MFRSVHIGHACRIAFWVVLVAATLASAVHAIIG